MQTMDFVLWPYTNALADLATAWLEVDLSEAGRRHGNQRKGQDADLVCFWVRGTGRLVGASIEGTLGCER